MINSIDVNSLLHREHRHQFLSDPVHSMSEIGNPFSDMFDSEDSAFCISHHWDDKTAFRFRLAATPESLNLELGKNQKKSTYYFTFSTQFLEIDGRRAESDDFKRFYAHLSHLQTFVTEHGAKVFDGDNEISDSNLAQKIVVQFMSHLTQFCAALSNGINESRQTSPMIAKLCLAVKSVIFTILNGRSEHAYISNAASKHKQDTTLFAYVVTLMKLLFVEKSSVQKTKVKVQPSMQVATMNNTAMSQSGVEWFMEKLELHLTQVKEKKATLFYATDKSS
ncbi:MAG: hypothetical protein O3A01_06755 [bacterium]|nr:hypothetical protein [bacterium]